MVVLVKNKWYDKENNAINGIWVELRIGCGGEYSINCIFYRTGLLYYN